MLPAIMPWLMTLAPTNEAIGRENYVAKNPNKENIYPNRIVLLSKKHKVL
jgi:hypothetical protein